MDAMPELLARQRERQVREDLAHGRPHTRDRLRRRTARRLHRLADALDG
ncbi:MAG: hypothetical protein Q7T56_11635 [Nocardioidaceae bacterium]|nr:hypothetical protein [Nocardioidaceae bacterium]